MKRFFISVILLMQLCNAISEPSSGPLLFETVSGIGASLNSRIYDFVQDPYGYMWFGTDYGLLRYDGYRTTRVQIPEVAYSTLLGSVGVQALALASDTSLWVGTKQGVLNLSLDSWEIVSPQQFHDLIIRNLLYVSDSILWVGTEQGLYRYNPLNEELIHYNRLNSNLSQNFIESIYLDKSGNLWVGTADHLNVLYAGLNVFETIDLKGDYKPDITHNLVIDIQALSEENDSVLVVGTETGLCVLDRFSLEYEVYNEQNCDLTNEVVKTIFAMDSSDIYFGTDLGFNRLNLKTRQIEKFYHNPFNRYSIANNEVWKVGLDKKGNLWLATSNGVNRLNLSADLFEYFPVYFDDLEEPVGTRVADVLLDPEGTYWIATSSGILSSGGNVANEMDFSRATGISSLSIDNINTIALDDMKRIWIGSVAGVNVWDSEKNQIHIPPMDDRSISRIASNYISTLFSGIDEHMWIGTWGGGLYKASMKEEHTDQINIQFVADFNGQMVMGKDHIWSLDGKLLFKFSFITQKVEEISELNEFAGDEAITSICYAANDCVWIGSKNQLFLYDIEKESFERIPMPIEQDFIVIGIIEDDEGFIWGSNANTIFRLDPDQKTFNYYPIPDRLPLSKLILSPFRKTAGGEILACGFDGFLKFNPGDFYMKGDKRKIRITSLKTNNELVDPGKTNAIPTNRPIVFPYGKRNLDIEYSSFQ